MLPWMSAPVQQGRPVDSDLRALGDHADDGCSATLVEHVIALFGGHGLAYGFEGVVDTQASSQPFYPVDNIALRRVYYVGSADSLCKAQLVFDGVDSDDLCRPGDESAVDGAEAHAAAADDGHGAPGLNPGRPHGRPDAGGHAAADEGLNLDRHVLFDYDRSVFVDEHVLSKGGEVHGLVDDLVALVQAREPRRGSSSGRRPCSSPSRPGCTCRRCRRRPKDRL